MSSLLLLPSMLSTLSSLLPSLTALVEVLPCTGYVDTGCIGDLVRGGCDPAAAAAIVAALGLTGARAAAELVAYTALLLSLPVPAWDASTVGAKGSSSKGDGTGEGCSKNESGRGKVSVDYGDAGVISNRQRKRIKLQQQKAMQSAAAVATAAAASDGGGAVKSGIACSSQKWQQLSLLEEEVARHAVRVQPHQHSVDFSVLSGGTKLFKLNHGHYKKLCLLAVVSCGGSIGGDPHQRAGASAVCISESDFNKLVYCVLSRYHLVLGHGFQMTLGKQAFDVLRTWFDIRFECFASPLNCICSVYALTFLLTDQCFGAVGNFFSLCPSSGSFKANHPFIAEVTLAMVVHIHELLCDATGPMSFVVIVPGWDDDPSWLEV